MYWGAGSELGLLTVLGDLFFLAGAATMWRGREDVSVWLHSEVGVLRRNLFPLHDRPALFTVRGRSLG